MSNAAPKRRSRTSPAAKNGPPLIVVLDEVEDPQNVGAILGSVDASGGTGVVRQTRRAAPLEGAAAKASAGAVNHVAVADVVNIARSLEELKKAGIWTVGLDAGAKMAYYEWDLTLPTAIVVGAEGHGLRRLVRERCDQVVSIPMLGHVGSLNVSVATAVVLFEAVRQRRSRSRGRKPRYAGKSKHPERSRVAKLHSGIEQDCVPSACNAGTGRASISVLLRLA